MTRVGILARTIWLWAATLVSAPLVAQSQPPGIAGKLDLHSPVEREMKPGVTDLFSIEPSAGQFIRIVAEQIGVDVVVSITGPDGKVLVRADRPNGAFGPEAASAI